MRIALDIRYRTRSGAASYIDSIVPGLTRMRSGHQFVVLRGRGQEVPAGTDCDSVVIDNASAAGQAVFDQLRLPARLRSLGIDVYHPLKHLGTLYPPCRQVTTAHSITLPFRGEFPVSRSEGIYWKTMGTRMFRRSTAVIAVSEFVRDFLVEAIGVAADRISVVHHGIDPVFVRTDHGTAHGRVESPYLLTVGNIFPVKNFVMAVRVLSGLVGEFPGLRLKMAGSTAHLHFQQIRAEARSLGVLDRIDFLGFCKAEQLVELMNQAELLLIPSLTEGFSLTLLEAMACGTAVVGSDRGAIPEVGADAIRLVADPMDGPGWIDAVGDLLRDPARLADLRERAHRRSGSFTWEQAVRRTMQVYDSLAASAPRGTREHLS
jgi:glycosyltransferase involved in cell wall biosynthesis